MADYFSPRSSTTNVYTFDSLTGKLSYAVMRLPPRSGSHCSTSSEAPVYTPGLPNADIQVPTLGEGSPRIVEEIPIRGGQTVYFVAKLHPRAPPRQGDPCVRRAKRQVMAMERLVWQLEAALTEEDGSSESDYEGDVDEYEDESIADDDCESDDGGSLDRSGAATDYPAANVNEDSRCDSDSDIEVPGPIGAEASASLSSDSSSDSVTFDPPSRSASPTEELAPSTASTIHPSTPFQLTPPSVSTPPSGVHYAIGDRSLVAADPAPPSLPQLESSYGDGSLSLETPSDKSGPGCPPTEQEPFCPACYGQPIRLLWGDEPSEESLSDLVDELLGESDFQFDEAGTLEPQMDVPIIAADWSLSQALASMGGEAKTGAISVAGSSSSMGSSFSERQEARAGSDSESDEEPLAETVKRRRETGSAGKDATTQDVPQTREALESDESVEIPLSTLRALRVEKGQPRPPAAGRSTSTGSSATVQQEPLSRRRKRGRDDEKEEGEISESDSESEPDVPLAHVLASRGKSAQNTLGRGPPPAKRLKFAPVVEPRRLSREGGRSRRSWAHKRWEERLKHNHARASHEGRRGIRIISTDEELLRRGMRAEERAYWRWDARYDVCVHGR